MKLSSWMEREGLDDQTVADRCAVDRTTILRIRKGTHKPSPNLMAELAKQTKGEVLPNDYFDELPEAEAA